MTKKFKMKKSIALFVVSKKFKNPKISYIFKKHQFFLLFAVSMRMKM